jgi:hypothetical protein
MLYAATLLRTCNETRRDSNGASWPCYKQSSRRGLGDRARNTLLSPLRCASAENPGLQSTLRVFRGALTANLIGLPKHASGRRSGRGRVG